jgi:ribosomal protein S18
MTTYRKRRIIVVTPSHTNISKTKNPQLAFASTFGYKKVNFLRRYLNVTGKIIPRYINCLNSKNHRIIVRSIKQARNIAQLPFVWVTYLYVFIYKYMPCLVGIEPTTLDFGNPYSSL